MLNFLPLPYSLPAPDIKITKEISLDPPPVPAPTPYPITEIKAPASSTPITDLSKAGFKVDPLSMAAMANLMKSGGDLASKIPSSSATSGADGNKSGDAYSTATFGDFIVNGSKGTTLGNVMLIGGSVLAVLLLIKTLGKKK